MRGERAIYVYTLPRKFVNNNGEELVRAPVTVRFVTIGARPDRVPFHELFGDVCRHISGYYSSILRGCAEVYGLTYCIKWRTTARLR